MIDTNMNSYHRKSLKVIAVLAAFAIVQVTFQLGLAESSATTTPNVPQQALLGRISIKGPSAATVDGNNASSGDSIASGSTVQTPGGTEATIHLGPLGSVEMTPGTRVRLDFSCPEPKANDPAACKLNVTLFAGCIITRYNEGSRHQIDNANQNKIAESDKQKEQNGGGVIRICSDGNVPPVPSPGLGRRGLLAILGAVGAAGVAIAIAASGDNPSPSTPGGS